MYPSMLTGSFAEPNGTVSLPSPPLRISCASLRRESASALAVWAASSWVLSSVSCWPVTPPPPTPLAPLL